MTERSKKPRRARVDSAAGVTAAIIAGGKTITLPPGTRLSASEQVAFTEICDEFSKSELTPHKVRMVVSLAKNMVALDQEQVQVMAEGSVLVNSHGNAFPNPRIKVCSGLTNSILAMRRSLGIHTRVLSGGDNREAAKRRAINKLNEAARDDFDDNLIAFPQPLPHEGSEDD